jgi:L-2-hydroxyglutarate oxidase LhgO
MDNVVELDTLIVGGGIMGLSLAKQLRQLKPEQTIALVETEMYLAEHSTGRNSGVIHAGLYYPHNGTKHRHCLSGNQLWEQWARELDIPFRRVGKFIVSPNDKDEQSDHSESLTQLYDRATYNEVPGLSWATEQQLKELQPFLNVGSAFYSASTGILDVSMAIGQLEHFCEGHDVFILKQNSALEIKEEKSHYFITTNHEHIRARQLVNCAGARAVELREMIDLTGVRNHLVKGHYLQCRQSRFDGLKHLIYPVPERNLKGLGVHITLDFGGQFKFGPDTLDVEQIDYQLPEDLVDKMFPDIKRIFKHVEREDLSLDYAGVRSKIQVLDADRWSPYPDFFLNHIQDKYSNKHYLEFLGIDSPGLTSAPSLAVWGCERLLRS